jgi:CheY-like chemotaxis protein/signal transduction histidine kinase
MNIKELLSGSIIDLTHFTPTSKVHAQRDVMREADARLAKYNRRGIFLSLVVFNLTIFIGEFYTKSPTMTLILEGGLFFITFIRAYFLLKFEHIYAQGPARWRKIFFFLSLLGSCWWGFIVASVTYYNGLVYETPILWLYTVALFAGSLYIYAPFQRFLKVYMFVSFIPCAIIAISSFQPINILYGLIMIILYLLLCRQGKFIGQNYWDKLEANYNLLKRTKTLEAEKITTESSLNNRDVLFNNLTIECKSSMQEIVGTLKLLKHASLHDEEQQLVLLAEQKGHQQISLLRNVAELSVISSERVLLDQDVIDLRYHIEQALSHTSIIAHKNNVELYSSFSSDFPLRVRGDAERLEQIIGNLISSACQFCEQGELLVSSSYRETDGAEVLKLSILNPNPIRTPEAEVSIHSAFSPHFSSDLKLGLNLAIVKGLANCMGGDAGAYYNDEGSLIFWISIRLDSVTTANNHRQNLSKLSGKKTLLFQAPDSIVDVFSKTLHNWGLYVDTANDQDEAMQLLVEADKRNPYQLIIIYTHLDHIESGLSFSKQVAEHESLWATPQIVALSKLQNKIKSVSDHFLKYVNIETIYKPLQHRKLHKLIKSILIENKKEAPVENLNKDLLQEKNLLLFQQEAIDIAIMKSMLEKLGCTVTTATHLEDCLTLLATQPFDAFICESHIEKIDLSMFVEKARDMSMNKDVYKLPILGITSHELEGEQTHCLASGMDYYIDFPVNISDLQAIVRRFIGRAIHMSENK